MNSLKVRHLSKGVTVTVLIDGSGIRCNEPYIPLPRENSITNGFVLQIGFVREQVGASCVEVDENAYAALLAHQAGFNMVTLIDPGSSVTRTFHVGPIRVERVGTAPRVVQVVVPPMVVGGIAVPTMVTTSGHYRGGGHSGGHGGGHNGGHYRGGHSGGHSGCFIAGKLASFGMHHKR